MHTKGAYVYEEYLGMEDEDLVKEITSILKGYGMTLNEFLHVLEHYNPKCNAIALDSKLWIIYKYVPVLLLIPQNLTTYIDMHLCWS